MTEKRELAGQNNTDKRPTARNFDIGVLLSKLPDGSLGVDFLGNIDGPIVNLVVQDILLGDRCPLYESKITTSAGQHKDDQDAHDHPIMANNPELRGRKRRQLRCC